jgi:hypothetical protein
MKLKELLQRAGKFMPYIGAAIGLTNLKLALDSRRARLEAANNENSRLLSQIEAKNNTIINNQTKQNEITRLSFDANDKINSANTHTRTSKELITKLNDPNTTQTERDQISSSLESNLDQQVNLLEQANNSYKKIMDIVTSNNESNSESNFISSFDYNELVNQFNILLENYKAFLSTLDVEQIVIVLNFLGLIVILFCFITIATIIYNDYLIKYLNKYFDIDNKYPRIAKFIQLRRKLQ